MPSPDYVFLKRPTRQTVGRYCTWQEWDDGSITVARKWPSTVAQPLTAATVRAAIDKMRRQIIHIPEGPCFAVGGPHVVHPFVVDDWTFCANCGSRVWVGPGNPPSTHQIESE